MKVKVNFYIATVPLGPLIELRRGISWDRSMEVDEHYPDSVPVLRIPNVQDHLSLDELLFLKKVNKDQVARFAATKGWTVIVGSNGNPVRVGNAVYIDENRGFLFASFLIALRPTDTKKLDEKFLYYLISSRFIQQAITESVQGTTGLSNLSQHTLFELPLPTFAVTDQRRIVAILDTVGQAIRQAEAELEKLKKIKAGLMEDLLTGRVPVTDLPKDVRRMLDEIAEKQAVHPGH